MGIPGLGTVDVQSATMLVKTVLRFSMLSSSAATSPCLINPRMRNSTRIPPYLRCLRQGNAKLWIAFARKLEVVDPVCSRLSLAICAYLGFRVHRHRYVLIW